MKSYLKVVLVLLFVFVPFTFAQDSDDPCGVTVTAETGLFTSNIWTEVGETYEQKPSVQSSLRIEKCFNKKVSAGASFWNALSTKRNPGPGTELDTMGFVTIHDKVDVTFEGGVYHYFRGDRAYVGRVVVAKSFELTESLEGTLTNSTGFYGTNISGLKGGVVNKTGFAVSGSYKKFDWAVTPSLSVDNNLFGLGNRRNAVLMSHFDARVDRAINDRVGVFAAFYASNPVAGDTNRRFRKHFAIGLTFNIK